MPLRHGYAKIRFKNFGNCLGNHLFTNSKFNFEFVGILQQAVKIQQFCVFAIIAGYHASVRKGDAGSPSLFTRLASSGLLAQA
jgi:hypothetical protein